MKLIAHRGNTKGPDPDRENNPQQIKDCIEQGYDVEIDVRYDPLTKELWLGHDEPQYNVTWWFLAKHNHSLWIHCKDITTLHHFAANTGGYNYFFHQNDDYTLTSKKIIWCYPGKPYTSKGVIVMPEQSNLSWESLRVTNCHGVCSDFIEKLK